MTASNARRHGFTLVELLVVIAIIGVLVALLLPAVQAAREAARRTHCQNNLKQDALAVIGFTEVKGRYPLGVQGGKPRAGMAGLTGGEEISAGFCDKGVGWIPKILPYLEQQALYDTFFDESGLNLNGDPFPFPNMLQFGPAILGIDVWRGADQVLPSFRCPSSQLPSHAEECINKHSDGYATSDYKGSNGFGDEGIFAHLCDRARASGTNETDVTINYVRPENVEDGLTNTIVIGESSYYMKLRSQTGGEGAEYWPAWAGGIVSDENTLFKTRPSLGEPINCGIAPKMIENFWYGTKPGQSILNQNSGPLDNDCAFSWHQGGAFFAMCDGSVRWLDEDIDDQIYENMGQRNDGQPIPGNF